MENQVTTLQSEIVQELSAELVQQFEIDSLSEDDMVRIKEIANKINMDDSRCIMEYGLNIQSKISLFADKLLNQVRDKDTSFVGDVLMDLVVDVQKLDVDSLSSKIRFLSKVPIIGDMVDDSKKFASRYKTLSGEIERVIMELEKARLNILKDINLLDDLYSKNLIYLKELNYMIIAAELKINEMHSVVIPEMKEKAQTTSDLVVKQRFNDTLERISRFENKVYDLKMSKMITIQTAPQIRLIQNNDQILVEKIQSSILNTIPLWKNQIVLSITMLRQKKVAEDHKGVTDAMSVSLAKNSKRIMKQVRDAAHETERGTVNIDKLKQVNSDLITTIEETIRIQRQGRERKMNSEHELLQLDQKLKEKLSELSRDI